jgi:outer membrane protein OmpA-like peptidoglycan-associated protein
MKLNLQAVSLMALALFVSPLAAQVAQPVENPPAATAPQAAEQVVPQEVLAMLADTRPVNELTVDELKKRVKTAKRFATVKSLPVELHDQLKQIAELAQGELQARQQADEQKAAGDQAAQDQAAAEKAATNKAAQEQAALDSAAKEQAAADKAAANKAALEQAAADKAAKEQAAADKAAANKAAQEQAALDKAAQEQAAVDKAAKEQSAADKAAADKAAQEQAAADKVTKEQAAADKAAANKAAQEQAALDKAAKDQAAADKAAAQKVAQEQAAAQKALDDKVAKAQADQIAADQLAKDQAAAQKDQQALATKPPVAEVVPLVPAPKPPVGVVAPADPAVKAPFAEVTPTAPSVKVPLADAVPVAPAVATPPAKIVLEAPPVAKVVPPPPAPPPEMKPLAQVVVPPPVAQVSAAPSAADVKALDSNIVDPASEKQAQAYLADQSDLTKLSDDDLRRRFDGIRELMTANELAHDTERAVREKLKIEREVLRQRVAAAEAAQQLKTAQASAANTPPAVSGAAPKSSQAPVAAGGNTTNITNTTNTTNTTNIITVLTPPQVVLNDRRPAENLDVSELQIRIQIFGDAQSNNAYDPSYRDYWRASVERDRAILRRRLIKERHRREAEMAMQAADDSFEISNDYVQTDRPRRDVFAAEIDPREMENVLVEPPRQFSANPRQRYNVEQIATEPTLRNSISRIEIDTIRFGTNEAFIRDEQVRNLDAIAAVIEKIVKKYPDEVFLIEGHTDAPGSAQYNERLSKLRAESIKGALTSYYVIPEKNLRTVGLGERFLKIPTAEAEPENRRVSIARITPLLVQR